MKNLGLRILLLFSIIGGPVSAQKQPKIIVGIVVDQMCYDYLYRYQQHFCSGGFNRFLNKGLNCRNTLYNYVPTYTGPGHASIYTGTTPSNHGIVGNEWYQRETKTIVNCVSDKTVQTVGSTSSEGQTSPRNLRTYTVTDQLKLASPESKVIAQFKFIMSIREVQLRRELKKLKGLKLKDYFKYIKKIELCKI